jgi:hypothetical protein
MTATATVTNAADCRAVYDSISVCGQEGIVAYGGFNADGCFGSGNGPDFSINCVCPYLASKSLADFLMGFSCGTDADNDLSVSLETAYCKCIT